MAVVRLNNDDNEMSRCQWIRRFFVVFVAFGTIFGMFVYYGGIDEHPSGLVLPTEHDLVELGLRTQNLLHDVEEYIEGEAASQGGGGDVKEESEEEKQQRKRKHYDPMNVVLFYADDWTQKVLGKLNPLVKTPNIDHMADNGMLFVNNCVTTSVCWMSRATLVTGVYSSRHLETEPPSMNMFSTNPWNQTLFPLMKQNDYFTGIVGKWHAPQPEEHMKAAFDRSRFYYGKHWVERDGKWRHVTELNQEDSIKFLQDRPKDRPFFLKVSFFATHADDANQTYSYQPQPSSIENLYNDITVPTPKTATDAHWKDLPPFFKDNNEGRNRWRKRFEPDYYQENVKNLYRMASEVDTAVGNIIEELKAQGVYNNTLLLFTTDNGNLHGEHGLAEKWYPFEESIRVPLVIYDPRMPADKRGTVNEDWTLSIDLAPTILGAGGIEPSDFMQGRDIADLYLEDDGPSSWRQDWFYEFNRGNPVTAEGHSGKNWIDASFALVNKDWKYVYWPQQEYEQVSIFRFGSSSYSRCVSVSLTARLIAPSSYHLSFTTEV